MRQSDAYYAASPEYGETGTISWMPTAARDFAEPGAESFDAILERVDRVQERLAETHRANACCASRTGASCTSSSAARSSATTSRPRHLPALYRISHANTGITIFERREDYVIDGVPFDGWALTDLERSGPPVKALHDASMSVLLFDLRSARRERQRHRPADLRPVVVQRPGGAVNYLRTRPEVDDERIA